MDFKISTMGLDLIIWGYFEAFLSPDAIWLAIRDNVHMDSMKLNYQMASEDSKASK